MQSVYFNMYIADLLYFYLWVINMYVSLNEIHILIKTYANHEYSTLNINHKAKAVT